MPIGSRGRGRSRWSGFDPGVAGGAVCGVASRLGRLWRFPGDEPVVLEVVRQRLDPDGGEAGVGQHFLGLLASPGCAQSHAAVRE